MKGRTLSIRGPVSSEFDVFPRVLVQPFTGVMVERFSRVSMMVISDSARFLLLVLLTVLGVMHRLTIPALDVFALLYGLMSALFQPAYMALRQQVFTPDIRNAANSLTQISRETTNLVGPSFGGLILSLSSAVFGFAIDALTFVASIISLLLYGLVVSMSGLGALLTGIIAGSVSTWRHRGVLAYGAIGGLTRVQNRHCLCACYHRKTR